MCESQPKQITLPYQKYSLYEVRFFVYLLNCIILGGPQPSVLQEVSIPIWGNGDCRLKYGGAAPGGIVDHMLCAGKASMDSCSVSIFFIMTVVLREPGTMKQAPGNPA